jgi:N-acetylmuramoyl-L-alanine amidase
MADAIATGLSACLRNGLPADDEASADLPDRVAPPGP